jgi:transcriptional regulator with XRE-family HTH domain
MNSAPASSSNPGSTRVADLVDEASQQQEALLWQLQARRESFGLTQEELAVRAGLSRVTVMRAETPKAGAALATFMRLAWALNLTPVLRCADDTQARPSEDLVHRGLSFNRTKHEPEWRDRQREAALATAWESANEHRPVGVSAVLPLLVPGATQAQATAAATVVQWLGSEVGFDFLTRALDQAGYTVTDSRAAARR